MEKPLHVSLYIYIFFDSFSNTSPFVIERVRILERAADFLLLLLDRVLCSFHGINNKHGDGSWWPSRDDDFRIKISDRFRSLETLDLNYRLLIDLQLGKKGGSPCLMFVRGHENEVLLERKTLVCRGGTYRS